MDDGHAQETSKPNFTSLRKMAKARVCCRIVERDWFAAFSNEPGDTLAWSKADPTDSISLESVDLQ